MIESQNAGVQSTQYHVRLFATSGHEVGVVTVRPPLERSQTRLVKIALRMAMPDVVWQGISAPVETLFKQADSYEQLTHAGSIVTSTLQGDGAEVVMHSDVVISEKGLLQ